VPKFPFLQGGQFQPVPTFPGLPTPPAFPQGQPGFTQAGQIDPSIQELLLSGQRDLDLSQFLAGSEFRPDSGVLGSVEQIVNGFASNRLAKRGEQRLSDALSQDFERQREQQEEDFRRQQKAESNKRSQELQADIIKSREAERAKAEFRDNTTPLQRDLQAAGIDINSPEVRQRILQGARGVTVNTGETSTPFQKEVAKGDAQRFTETQAAAQAAAQGIPALDQLNNLQITGKANELQARIGQLFGSEAAADLQTFRSLANRQVLSVAQQLSGPISEKELNFLRQAAPDFGNEPRANAEIIRILKKSAQGQIKIAQEMEVHVQRTGSLRGFSPSITGRSPSDAFSGGGQDGETTPAQGPTQVLSSLSDEELLRAIGG